MKFYKTDEIGNIIWSPDLDNYRMVYCDVLLLNEFLPEIEDARRLAWEQTYNWARLHGYAMGLMMRPGDLDAIMAKGFSAKQTAQRMDAIFMFARFEQPYSWKDG
jgi:hypothetical protein